MSRPRIRTIKPECWADEKIAALSYQARCLFVGLVTMSDDEGRLRAYTAQILGHVFPADQQAPRKLHTWLEEIESKGIIVTYEVAGTPYIAFRHWRRHQKINRATPSVLPSPPDKSIELNNRVVGLGEDFTEVEVSDQGEVTPVPRREGV